MSIDYYWDWDITITVFTTGIEIFFSENFDCSQRCPRVYEMIGLQNQNLILFTNCVFLTVIIIK